MKNCALYKYGARCWWLSWLRHRATNRNIAGSIPDGVTGIFHWHNFSSRTMTLGSNQPRTEMSFRNTSWGGKGNRCVVLTNLVLHVPTVLKSGLLNLLEPSGPVQACNSIASLHFINIITFQRRAWLFLYCIQAIRVSRRHSHTHISCHVRCWGLFQVFNKLQMDADSSDQNSRIRSVNPCICTRT